ncbi:MAG TPA: sigma-54 dependent transcriptional regulator [Polyangia bacterium]|nr:sigma-54 dependent transcriptional regulator [Polyangia bacterium]
MDTLIVDDDPAVRMVLRKLLTRRGDTVVEAEDGKQAIDQLGGRAVDLVITDLLMPRANGLEVLRYVRERKPQIPVIMLTAEGSIRDCVEAMRAGAFNFLTKPFHNDDLEEIIRQATRGRRSPPEPGAPVPVTSAEPGQPQIALVGESEALRAVIDMVERIAGSGSTVLITGESGTGKEVVARLLHYSSPRVGQPFVAVNCGAIPETLIESELFGHVKGAFTGAVEARQGRFAQADGGTLFLDEIGELALPLQVRLLRVLQERVVTPVGDSRVRAVDVRVIAATNRDLEAMVKEGKFRQDLFYRLEVLPVRLPALRERREDIPLLAAHFLESTNQRLGRQVAISEDALTIMRLYDWPGNVREMENLFERLVVLSRGEAISASDLPERMRAGSAAPQIGAAAASLARGAIDLVATMGAVESTLIEQAMRQASGNKTHAAELLGLSRTTLLDKLKRGNGD